MGRFLTQDPLGDIDGPNRYAFCGGDPVNRTDPMGTDYIDAQDGIAYWAVEAADYSRVLRRVPLGTVNNGVVSIYDGLGGGNIGLSALQHKVGYRDPTLSAKTELDRSIYGELDRSDTIKSSDPGTYLGAIQDQLYLLGGVTHRSGLRAAQQLGNDAQTAQTLIENSPWLGRIRDEPWFIKYPHAYFYSVFNTLSGTFLEAQDRNTAAYDLGWQDIDSYVSGTRRDSGTGYETN